MVERLTEQTLDQEEKIQNMLEEKADLVSMSNTEYERYHYEYFLSVP